MSRDSSLISISFCFMFAEFRNGRCPILVATDVAARGLGQWSKLEAAVGWEGSTQRGPDW